jgi:hypothetical protein
LRLDVRQSIAFGEQYLVALGDSDTDANIAARLDCLGSDLTNSGRQPGLFTRKLKE